MGNMAYNREHTTTYLLRFNHKTDKDIIEKLETVGNKTAYIKRLIRADLGQGMSEDPSGSEPAKRDE